ncbi:MAG TPA: hypothetical protein VFN64_09570 [Burkholderiaceae bacterium]|nr:hypothetical protein [Burkholderiaceae bacterium]
MRNFLATTWELVLPMAAFAVYATVLLGLVVVLGQLAQLAD